MRRIEKSLKTLVVVAVVVITPPLPRMEVRHERQFKFLRSISLKLGWGKDGSPFRTSHE